MVLLNLHKVWSSLWCFTHIPMSVVYNLSTTQATKALVSSSYYYLKEDTWPTISGQAFFWSPAIASPITSRCYFS
ncbi:MAG: hypothetical protein O4965_23600 [Trichodesmium sp. St19_bin1]|nr:hypothetical protein [Trichodesmium sp. St19_bin1]